MILMVSYLMYAIGSLVETCQRLEFEAQSSLGTWLGEVTKHRNSSHIYRARYRDVQSYLT